MEELDARDWSIIRLRMHRANLTEGPRVGDWVRFHGGGETRIAYIWEFDGEPGGFQPSQGGSYYLGSSGYISFSGSLHRSIPLDTLTEVGCKDGEVWIHHHDYHAAHTGVEAVVSFRLFHCSAAAPGR